MRIVVLRCGGADLTLSDLPGDTLLADAGRLGDAAVVERDVPVRPGRGDLAFLGDLAKEVLPVDDTPTPADIGKRKKVDELGAPEIAPQRPAERLRVVVAGPDASLAAVATHLMRRNLLWVELAHVPGGPTPATRNWGLGDGLTAVQAISRPVDPVPAIRDDTGAAIVGYALFTGPGVTGPSSRGGLVGEVWAGEDPLFSGTAHGVQVRPTPDAPGLVAAEVPPPAEEPGGDGSGRAGGRGGRGFLGRLFGRGHDAPDPDEGLTDAAGNPRTMHGPMVARAVQIGGPGFRYVHDGIESKRPREKATIYRHLRDLQLVR